MTCIEARDAFSDLYDGILSGPALTAMSRHLDECQACREEWRAFRQTVQAVSRLGVDEPPPEFASRVLARIERPSWWRRAARLWVYPVSVKAPLHAAALCALLVAGWWMLRETPETERAARLDAPSPVTKPAPSPPPDAPPPSVPGKVGVSPRLKAEAPLPEPSVPAPDAKDKGVPETKGDLRETLPEAPASKAAPPADAGRAAPTLPGPPPPKGGAPPKALAKGAAPSPAPEVLRQSAAPMPSPAPRAEEMQFSEKALPRETLRGESAARRRDAVEPAAPSQAPRRIEKPEATLPPAGMGATRPSASRAPAAMPADERFSAAATAFAAREYAKSAEEFQSFLAEQPQDRRAADARFYLAESLFALGRHEEAAAAYADFLKERPDHRQAVTALYRQGLARLARGDTAGCALLKTALERAPRAADAAAKEALANCP